MVKTRKISNEKYEVHYLFTLNDSERAEERPKKIPER